MQVQCAFTVAAGNLTVTMPPNSSIAPPANYMLFAVTSQGRPSQAVYIGLGGATPATSYFTDPAVTPFFANGTYNITSRARRGTCAAALSYQFCNTSNDVIMDTQGDIPPTDLHITNNKTGCTASHAIVSDFTIDSYILGILIADLCRVNTANKCVLWTVG